MKSFRLLVGLSLLAGSIFASAPATAVAMPYCDGQVHTTVQTTSVSAAQMTLAQEGKIVYKRVKASAHPARVYANLTRHEKKAFKAYESMPKVTVKGYCGSSATMTVSGGSCANVHEEVFATNPLGMVGFDYHVSVDYCYDGVNLTSHNRTVAGFTHMLFLEYDGNLYDATSGGDGTPAFYSSAQGKFQVCIPFQNIGCFGHWNPLIEVNVFGDGHAERGGWM